MVSVMYWAAALLAFIFAINLSGRFRRTKAPVYGWWTLSFILYVLAFVMEALTVSSNWHVVSQYQLYIVASAGLVGTMSVGTTYLALPRSRVAKGYALYVTLVGLALILLTLMHPPVLQGSWAALNAGKNAIVGPTQVAYLLLSAVGGPIVVIGSLWSWWKTRRYYTLLIAAGALVPSSAGTLASQGLGLAWFPIMNIIGLALIFLGYIYSQPRHGAQLNAAKAGQSEKEHRNGRTAG